jgi:hypothetical protein
VNDLWDGTVLVRAPETPRHQMIIGALAAVAAGEPALIPCDHGVITLCR